MTMYKRQRKQPKPYWNILIKKKSNKCEFWNEVVNECEHPKRHPDFGDYKCIRHLCPIRIFKVGVE